MRLWAWGQSDPGRSASATRIATSSIRTTGVLAVADGMGGHQGGATASRMAVELLAQRARARRAATSRPRSQQADASSRCARPRRCRRSTTPTGDLAPTIRGAADGGDRCRAARAIVFSPALELMRGVVRRASSARSSRPRGRSPSCAAWARRSPRCSSTAASAHLVHAGDSRCYMFRDGQLRQLTEDHSWIAEQLQERLDHARPRRRRASSAT